MEKRFAPYDKLKLSSRYQKNNFQIVMINFLFFCEKYLGDFLCIIYMIQNDTIFVPKNPQRFICDCGNIYKYHSGIYRHKKVCKKEKDKNFIEKRMTLSLCC